MSSGCVFRNLFKCEKKCDSVASRKALLQEFTSKVYNAEVIYVDNEGKTTEEQYGILFQLSETQKDSEMIKVHGNAIIQDGEDTPMKASWSGIYLANKNGYKIRLSGDNIEKNFYLYCDGNETIHFLIKNTVSGDSRQIATSSPNTGNGTLSSLEEQLSQLTKARQNLYDKYDSSFTTSEQEAFNNRIAALDMEINQRQLLIIRIYYYVNKSVYPQLITVAQNACAETTNVYEFCQDPTVKYNKNTTEPF